MRAIQIPLLIFIVLLVVTPGLEGQGGDSLLLEFPSFSLRRDLEDYEFLKERTEKGKGWQSFKYIPLSKQSWLSLGGNFRSELQGLRNEDWTQGNDDTPVFLRFMLHGDLKFRQRFRLFTQLKSAFAIGRNGPVLGLNEDRLDVHQFFLGLPIGSGTLEVGRRELWYGSRRLLSIREGTNVRHSFDGLRWIWENRKNRLDVLLYAYNPQRPGLLDNRISFDQLLWGIYYVRNRTRVDPMNFDLYYLGVRNRMTRFEEGDDREVRHSWGFRHWGESGAFSYNTEFILQLGTFGIGQIRAWTISTELYLRLSGNAKIGLKTEVISGDRDSEDGNLQTFNPLYPRGGYFGLLAVIGPANLLDFHPSVQFQVGKEWTIDFDWDIFWRYSLQDGIYFPSGRLNVAGTGSSERFIGHQFGVQIARSINRFVEVQTSYFHFFAGSFLKDQTAGADFSQFGLSVSYTF